MAKKSKGRVDIKEDIDAYCEELRRKDIGYAHDLDGIQSNFIKTNPRIRNWKDFKDVEEMKRVMIGLHDKSTRISGDITVEILKFTDK